VTQSSRFKFEIFTVRYFNWVHADYLELSLHLCIYYLEGLDKNKLIMIMQLIHKSATNTELEMVELLKLYGKMFQYL